MKKTTIILVAFFMGLLSSKAQLLQFGIKAGINYANETGTAILVNANNYKKEAITSYHIGVVAEMPLFGSVSFQPELLYSTVGTNYKALSVGEDIQNDRGYISIPAIVKIGLNKTISLELGPQASFLLSNKKVFNVNDTQTFDFGLAGGLGLKLTKSIFIQGRYVLGLSEVSEQAKAKNSVVQVSAGIFF